MKYCKVCQKEIPQGRMKLGYTTTCVEHSNTFKYVGVVGGSGEADYEISIIKDSETAEHMQRLINTIGNF